MSRGSRSGAGDVTLAFLLGAAAGAAVALLFAPAAGRNTREFLGQKAREGQDTLFNAVERGREAFEQARDRSRDKEPA
jgi:gas vesicle protein